MKPKIVSVLSSYKTLFKDIHISRKYNADLLELRIDLMFDNFCYNSEKVLKTILELKKLSKLPLIGTIRIKNEGGNFNLSENKRLFLFKTIIPHVDYIDIELKSNILKEVLFYTFKKRKKIIISYHNFKNTPDIKYLKEIIRKSMLFKPDIIKIATLVKCADDFDILSRILFKNKQISSNISIIPMTYNINLSFLRYLCYYLGSKLLYFSSSCSVAPGQHSIKTCFDILKK